MFMGDTDFFWSLLFYITEFCPLQATHKTFNSEMKEEDMKEEETKVDIFMDNRVFKKKICIKTLSSPSGQNEMFHSWRKSRRSKVAHQAWWKVVI